MKNKLFEIGEYMDKHSIYFTIPCIGGAFILLMVGMLCAENIIPIYWLVIVFFPYLIFAILFCIVAEVRLKVEREKVRNKWEKN